jgi:hypothetical protein
MDMSEQTLNMLKKLSPKKEHSLAFRCFIGAAAIVLLTVSVHILVFTAIEKHSEIRNLPEWYQLLAGLSVDALYPLFIVSLASIIKRVFRIPVHRLERKVFKFTYLCLGLIAASRISMYVGLYVFFMALFAAGTAIYISLSAYVFSTNCLNTASYPAGIIKWRTIRLRVIRRSVTGLCMGYGHNKCRGPFHQVPRHFLYRINDCFDLSVITSWFILFGKLK